MCAAKRDVPLCANSRHGTAANHSSTSSAVVLDILRAELKVAMTLTGCRDVSRATPDLLLKD
jgi:isopentenyl diphosphate isomerase/L-lactate dehydrogenase-like FMN-dependent dehydrogenase